MAEILKLEIAVDAKALGQPDAFADRRFAASTGSCSRVALIKAAERRKASRQRFVVARQRSPEACAVADNMR